MINLDPKALYKITKVKTNNPDSRYIQDGDEFVGQAEIFERRSATDKTNSHLRVGSLYTSPLVKCEELDNCYLVQTNNSVYLLVKQD